MGYNVPVVFNTTLHEEKTEFGGDNYATFTVKLSESVYDKATKTDKYENRYWDVKVFGKTIERLRGMAKGQPLQVVGSLDSLRPYESNSEGGGLRVGVTVIANSVSKCPKDFTEDNEMNDPMDEEEEAPSARRMPPKPSGSKVKY